MIGCKWENTFKYVSEKQRKKSLIVKMNPPSQWIVAMSLNWSLSSTNKIFNSYLKF